MPPRDDNPQIPDPLLSNIFDGTAAGEVIRSGDTDAEERETVDAIVGALAGSGLEKVVAASTFGARPGERCGDLTVLHGFEEKLRAQPIPAAINRGAYYMSNWAGMLEPVLQRL